MTSRAKKNRKNKRRLKKPGCMMAAAFLSLAFFFSFGGESMGALRPYHAPIDYVPASWILRPPERLVATLKPRLDFDGEVFGEDIRTPLEAQAPPGLSPPPASNSYGNAASAVLSGEKGPEEDGAGWAAGQTLADRESLWMEKAQGLSPGPHPDYDSGQGAAAPWAEGPDNGNAAGQKTWRLSDEDSIFYSLDGNYGFPCGRQMDGGLEYYSFNTVWRYETTRLSPVVLDAQTTDGYLPGNTIPLGFQLTAHANVKKASISGNYSMNTGSSDLDSMTPVVHQFGGDLGYKLARQVDVSGAVTYTVSDFTPNDGQVYQGGIDWRPSVADAVASEIKLTDSGYGRSYEVFTGFQRRLAPAESFSFNSDFNRDLYHFVHEHFSLAYAWRWGKYFFHAALGTTIDEPPVPGEMLIGRTCTVGITRTFGVPVAGIF